MVKVFLVRMLVVKTQITNVTLFTAVYIPSFIRFLLGTYASCNNLQEQRLKVVLPSVEVTSHEKAVNRSGLQSHNWRLRVLCTSVQAHNWRLRVLCTRVQAHNWRLRVSMN